MLETFASSSPQLLSRLFEWIKEKHIELQSYLHRQSSSLANISLAEHKLAEWKLAHKSSN